MKKNNMRMISKTISVILIISVIVSILSINTYYVAAKEDPVVVVSLGDSYSSGEGIPAFIGQDFKEKSYDWLAHRSTKSWASQLEIPGVEGTLADYYEQLPGFSGFTNGTVVKSQNPSVCKWYFVASSGATTQDVYYTGKKRKQLEEKGELGQKKDYHYEVFNDFNNPNPDRKGTVYLPEQIKVFDNIEDNVDYVTLTLGGNDVNFEGIVIKVVTNCTYQFPYTFELDGEELYVGSDLYNMILSLWDKFEKETKNDSEKNIKTKLIETYQKIHEKAPNASIIVAGYPELFKKGDSWCNNIGALIEREEALFVDANVRRFNYEIEKIVQESQSEMDINFVDVTEEFEGHQAYSDDPWINPIMLLQDQDLKVFNLIDISTYTSAYSIHPNYVGAAAYARCINEKLPEIAQKREERNSGYLSGKICDASDKTTPIPEATINIYKDDKLEKTEKTDAKGNFNIYLYRGSYSLEIKAEGYNDFKCEAKVFGEKNNNLGTLALTKDSANQSENYTITLTWDSHSNLDARLEGSGHVDMLGMLKKGVPQPDIISYSDSNSYGPERVVLKPTSNGPYYFSVFCNDGSIYDTIYNKGAFVSVEYGGQVIASYNIEDHKGSYYTSGRYWNVFMFKDGEFIEENSISSVPETAYLHVWSVK